MQKGPLCICLSTLICLISHSIWAKGDRCPEPPVDPQAAKKVAGQLFKRAEQDFRNQRPFEALRGFLCSLSIIEHENTMFNVAQIVQNTENKRASLELLQRYAADHPRSLMIGRIDELIDELRSALQLDDSPYTSSTHRERPEPIEQAAPPPNPLTAEPAVRAERKTNGMKVAGWILMGTGVGALAAGSIMQGAAGGAQEDAESATTYELFAREERRMRGLQAGALIGFIAGGVLAGSGLVLFLVSTDEGESSDVSMKVIPGPNGFLIKGRF